MNRRVDADVDILQRDLLRLRDDLANIVRSLRARVKNRARKEPPVVVEVPSPAPTTAVRVEKLKPRRRLSARKAVGIFAAGLIAALLLTRERQAVVLEMPQPGRKRSRLTAFVPWVGRARRRETVAAVNADRPDVEHVATVRGTSRIEERQIP